MSTTVITPEFRGSYVNVLEPREDLNGNMKYSICMVFHKDTDLSELKAAMKEAAVKKWGEDQKQWPKKMLSPIHDGDEERDDPNFENTYYINATAREKYPPGVVDSNVKPIMDASEIYSGAWYRAQVQFYAYDTAGNRGIGCGLLNVMKVKDDEAFGSAAPKPEQAFAGFAKGGSSASPSASDDDAPPF